MKLCLLRHGIAEELGPRNNFKDANRALTDEGEQKLSRIVKAMLRMELSFDLILSSPYRRAHDTAKIVAEKLQSAKGIEVVDFLKPGGSPPKLLEHLRNLRPPPDSVLLVGHEPDLSALISFLVFGDTSGVVILKKGGLCQLNLASLRPGRCAACEWLLTPKQMLLMS